MSYFQQIPTTSYEFNQEIYSVKDIFKRAAFISEYKPYSDLYQSYLIKDGETPEMIAAELYGSPNFYWVILVFNEIHDMLNDWPLDTNNLTKLCDARYGETGKYAVRHYEKGGYVVGQVAQFVSEATWVSPSNPYPLDNTVIPVTFLDYENSLNEARRSILLLRPELLAEFINQYEAAINE